MARLDQTPKTVSINDLSHDGRGVARWPDGHAHAGKTVFVAGALPGETVVVQQTARSRHFDEAKTLEELSVSLETVEPIMGVKYWDPSVEIETELVSARGQVLPGMSGQVRAPAGR